MSSHAVESKNEERVNATRVESAEETFFFYRSGRWFWINAALILALCISYTVIDPLNGHNGGTWYGYATGTFAATGIGYLMWYGMRKRSYHSHTITLQGCLSAHVWLGIALAIIVPLHSGFQFSCNIHTVAYLLMMIVIGSGLFGAVNYVRLAPLIAAHRGGGHAPQLIEQIDRLSREIDSIPNDRSDAFMMLRKQTDFTVVPSVWLCLLRKLVPAFNRAAVSDLLTKVPSQEHSEALRLVSLVTRKRELAQRLQEDVRVLTLLKIWLWVHVPLSFALVCSVLIHILVVFLYR